MKYICPICEKETDVTKVESSEVFNIRGDEISVPVEHFQCHECNESFDDPLSLDDPIDLAYKEYRKTHEMVQPDEIRDYRKRYDLTQKELSCLLGWGGATLSRYENGALQDDTHETVLRLAMEPKNLLKLVKERPKALQSLKRKEVIEKLELLEHNHSSFKTFYEDRFSTYSPDLLNGFKKLDVTKVFNCVIYFCLNGVWKTKLNKLLFYADFKHYKDNSSSITGLRYVKLPFGPVPENYDHYFASLHHEEKAIRVEEETNYNSTGEIFTSEVGYNLTVFSETEFETLEFVKNYFKDFNAKEISEFSHKEHGYLETNIHEFIPYTYSESLKI